MAERIQVMVAGELFDVAKPDQVNTLSEEARRIIISGTAQAIAVFSFVEEFEPILAPANPDRLRERVQNLRCGLVAFGVDADVEIEKARAEIEKMEPGEKAALVVRHINVPPLS